MTRLSLQLVVGLRGEIPNRRGVTRALISERRAADETRGD